MLTSEPVIVITTVDKEGQCNQLNSIMVFGKNYPEGVNEIQEAGLTELKSTIVKPPRIAEYKAHIECRFKWEKEVVSHMLVAGEMLTGSCDKGLLDEEGYFDKVSLNNHPIFLSWFFRSWQCLS